MAEMTRADRDSNTRDTTQRRATWTPPQILPEPKPQHGFRFRWIRTALMGQFDPTNTSAKLREGWEPVKTEDHPELMIYSDPNSRFKGNVENGGLLLCKAPMEMVEQRTAWYNKQAASQMDAVDSNFMKTNDARMPLFSDKKSSVSFGRGTK